MKKHFTLLFLLIAILAKTYAASYTISFTCSGVSTYIDSVIVKNLTKGTSVVVPGGNVLSLIDATAVEQVSASDEFIRIYPNHAEGKSTLSFFAKQAGNTQINAFGIDGRKIIGITTNLPMGVNSFRLSLPNGTFVIQVLGNDYNYTTKLINQNAVLNKQEIVFVNTEKLISQKSKSSTSGTILMSYSTGDQLLYKGVSNQNYYRTIVMDKPTASKSVNFVFFDCSDANYQSYTVVQIGSQIWMAENLKTRKFNDKTDIPYVSDDSWFGLTTPAYCFYNNDGDFNKKTYGCLYNYYAYLPTNINISKLLPTGWSLPNDADWSTLITYLGGANVAGAKLKETGTTHWTNSNNNSTNESGFTALPGGRRSDYFVDINTAAYFMVVSNSSLYTNIKCINGNSDAITAISQYDKMNGLSIRCIKK